MAQKEHKTLGDKFEEISVNIEAVSGAVKALKGVLSGEIRALKEIVGMSRAEQHTFNEYVIKMLDAHEAKIEAIEKEMECAHLHEHVDGHEKKFEAQEKRIRKVEVKQSYIAGVWVAILAAVETAKYFWGH